MCAYTPTLQCIPALSGPLSGMPRWQNQICYLTTTKSKHHLKLRTAEFSPKIILPITWGKIRHLSHKYMIDNLLQLHSSLFWGPWNAKPTPIITALLLFIRGLDKLQRTTFSPGMKETAGGKDDFRREYHSFCLSFMDGKREILQRTLQIMFSSL